LRTGKNQQGTEGRVQVAEHGHREEGGAHDHQQAHGHQLHGVQAGKYGLVPPAAERTQQQRHNEGGVVHLPVYDARQVGDQVALHRQRSCQQELADRSQPAGQPDSGSSEREKQAGETISQPKQPQIGIDEPQGQRLKLERQVEHQQCEGDRKSGAQGPHGAGLTGLGGGKIRLHSCVPRCLAQ
jgi:hypothetical protein